MSERNTFFHQGGFFFDMGAQTGLTFLFLSYRTNKDYFQSCLWGPFRASPIFFGVRGFPWRLTSRCETTGMT